MAIADRLKQLGITLPTLAAPVANYVPYVLSRGTLYLSGQGPKRPDGSFATGKVGANVTVEEAYQHARLTGLGLLAAMEQALGSLDRVERVVKLLGMVNCTPEFGQSPAVINGCSDLFVEVFGEAGRHARSAVGLNALPNGITVEIEAIVEVKG